jgi:hypothetical protein
LAQTLPADSGAPVCHRKKTALGNKKAPRLVAAGLAVHRVSVQSLRRRAVEPIRSRRARYAAHRVLSLHPAVAGYVVPHCSEGLHQSRRSWYSQCTRIVVQVKPILRGVTLLSPACPAHGRSGWRRPRGRDARNRRSPIRLRARRAAGSPRRPTPRAATFLAPWYAERHVSGIRTLGGPGLAPRDRRRSTRGFRPVHEPPGRSPRPPSNKGLPGKVSLVNNSRCATFVARKRFVLRRPLPVETQVGTGVANAYA